MKYKYKIIKDNKPIAGLLEAESKEAVLSHFKDEKSTIIEIKESDISILEKFNNITSKVSFTDIVDMTRQTAIMLSSGLTIIESLDILKKQAKNKAVLKLFDNIENNVKSGMSLSNALRENKNIFSNLYISLVRAGEASGKLDAILMKLSSTLERQRTFRGKLKGAMIYPALVIIMMTVVFFIMITFVIPQLLEVYKDFDVELPASTQFLIIVSSIFNKYWPIIAGGIFLLVIIFTKYYRSKSGKYTIDSILLKMPLISNVIKISALVNTTQTLAILVEAGVSILEALDIVTETTSNIVYQRAFIQIRDKIEKGMSLGTAFESVDIFPPILVQMTTVGEQTGHLDSTLNHLADYFESESEIAIKSITTLIEPSILIILGISVGFVVIAVITPIFKLSSAF